MRQAGKFVRQQQIRFGGGLLAAAPAHALAVRREFRPAGLGDLGGDLDRLGQRRHVGALGQLPAEVTVKMQAGGAIRVTQPPLRLGHLQAPGVLALEASGEERGELVDDPPLRRAQADGRMGQPPTRHQVGPQAFSGRGFTAQRKLEAQREFASRSEHFLRRRLASGRLPDGRGVQDLPAIAFETSALPVDRLKPLHFGKQGAPFVRRGLVHEQPAFESEEVDQQALEFKVRVGTVGRQPPQEIPAHGGIETRVAGP